MLLMLGISAVVSCNSYDVEGRPEVASNPAKKVFAYYPWAKADEENKGNAAENSENNGESGENGDNGGETGDNGAENGDNGGESGDNGGESGDNGAENGENGAENGENGGENGGESGENNGNNNDGQDPDGGNGDESGENGGIIRAVKAAEGKQVITEKFEIYNRGLTGELKIRKINLLDPNGNLIKDLSDADYKNLFTMQIQKMNKGLAVENAFENATWDFDNMAKDTEAMHIGSLCPLTEKANGTEKIKVCKEGFDKSKYNSSFTILLHYSQEAADKLENKPKDFSEKFKTYGDFSIEICTNDPTKALNKTKTCGDNSTSYQIQIRRQKYTPPKPIIHVSFVDPIQKPMSYRNIYDTVQMNLKETCVSNPDNKNECLKDWEKKYYIKYKWEMTESPTPLLDQSRLTLTETSGSAGQWLADDGVRENPKSASFTGLMITPRRYAENNKTYDPDKCASECGTEPADDPNNPDKYFFMKLSQYLLCHQKYCEKQTSKYYKINIQAETVDKETDLVSETTDITIVPKIIPQARVVAQLTWQQGFKTKAESESKDGAMVDIDIHMIKYHSKEAEQYDFAIKEGLLGTSHRSKGDTSQPTEPENEKYWRHDDCSFSDPGLEGTDEGRTIGWHASLDIDNTWGGNNYETPETIGLGPILDKDDDGIPDDPIEDDLYLIVVGYVNCASKPTGASDRCDPSYTGKDAAYEVDARVEILIDGANAPREAGADRPADNYGVVVKDENGKDTTSVDFKIKVHEWKAIAVVKWDNSWKGPETNQKYTGNALVTQKAMPDQGITIDPVSHPVCTYEMADAVLIPIWDAKTYKEHIEFFDDNTQQIGTCEGGSYPDPDPDTTPDTGDTDTGDTDTGDTDTGDTDTGDTQP